MLTDGISDFVGGGSRLNNFTTGTSQPAIKWIAALVINKAGLELALREAKANFTEVAAQTAADLRFG